MSNKTCCITGHRKIAPEKLDFVKSSLNQAIKKALDEGYTHFISGFAEGIDLIFAAIIVEFKNHHPITLEAAIPYTNRLKTPDSTFQKLINHCDIVKSHSTDYAPHCFMRRNRYMVDNSTLIIAVHDGRETGGTIATIKYAKQIGREIACIHIGLSPEK